MAAGDTKLQDFIRTALVRPAFLPVLDEWRRQVAAGETPTNLLADPEYVDAQLGPYRATEALAARQGGLAERVAGIRARLVAEATNGAVLLEAAPETVEEKR